jgi:tetratricopeptide (TPR) repeat protein
MLPIMVIVLSAALLGGAASAQDNKPIEWKAIVNPLEEERAKIKSGQENEIVMPPEAMENPPPGSVKPQKPDKSRQDQDDQDGWQQTPERKKAGGGDAQGKSPEAGKPEKNEKPDKSREAAKTPPKKEEQQAARNIMLVVPQERIQDILKHWEKRRDALAARDQATADAELKTIARIRQENGARNLFGIASALLRESVQAMNGRDFGRALTLAATATDLAPDLSTAHFQVAFAAMRSNRTNAIVAVKAVQEGMRDAIEDPPTAINLAANACLVLGMGVLLALLMFTISVMLKYGRLIIHDQSHLFPDGAPPVFTGLIVLLFLFIPLVLGAGVILCIIFWSVVAWIYASARERLILAVCAASFALLPLAYPTIAVMLDQGENDAIQTYRVFRDGEAVAEIAKVTTEAGKGSKDPYKLWGAALWLKRAGKYADAEPLLRRAIDALPKNADLQVNMGNLLLVQDRFYEAQNAYTRALELDPFNALGHYNLSQLFFRFGAIEKGQREHQEAVRLDPGLLETASASSSSINLFVLDAQPSDAEIFRMLLAPSSPRRVLITNLLERYTLGDFSRGEMPFVLGAAAALVTLLTFLRRRLSPSAYCAKCGSPSCTRCNPEMTAHTHCGQCFHLYILRDVPDSRMRGQKEIEAWQHTRRSRIASSVLAVLVPGSGQVLTGSPIAGFMVMCVAGLAAVLAITAGGPLPGRFSGMHTIFWWTRMGVLAVAALIYLQSLRSAMRKA